MAIAGSKKRRLSGIGHYAGSKNCHLSGIGPDTGSVIFNQLEMTINNINKIKLKERVKIIFNLLLLGGL